MKKSYFKLIIFAVCITALITTITSHAQIISTIAGTGTGTYGGDGGAATAAQLRDPADVAIDGSGNLYIADWNNHRVRKISTSGTITTIAGTGGITFAGDGGPATAATLYQPASIAIDGSGNIYVTDNLHRRIRKIDGAGNITTFAGNGTSAYAGDGGPATAASIANPRGITFDAAGNLYIADADNNRIRKVDVSGNISTVAGNGSFGFSGDGSAATSAKLNGPKDVAVDAAGNIYIADDGNHRIRKVNTAGIISTYAGTGSTGTSGDGGAATAASTGYCGNICIDAYGNLFISTDNHVRKVNSAGIISRVAGTGAYSFSGDGGPATAATFTVTGGLTKSSSGTLYVCDESNHRLRQITPAPVTISGSGTVCVGSTITLTGSASGGTWTSAITGYATVGSSSGIVSGVAAGIVTISYTESGVTGTKTITVNALPAPITGTLTVCVGAVTSLSSTSGGGAWVSSSPTIGSIDGLGNVTGVSAGTTVITYALMPSFCQTIAVVTVDPCSTLSVNEVNEQPEVNIYPNPSNGSFTVNLPANTTMMIITDNLGRTVVSKNIETTLSPSISFTTDMLPSGQYIIKTFTRERAYTNKLIITR